MLLFILFVLLGVQPPDVTVVVLPSNPRHGGNPRTSPIHRTVPPRLAPGH